MPRGHRPNRLREKIAEINASLADFPKSNSSIRYMDVGHLFVDADGRISHEDMHDYLHLTRRGYYKLCRPVYEEIVKVLDQS